MKNFDLHTHVVPSSLPANRRRSEAWPSVEHAADGQAAVMVRGKVFRKIDSRSWDVSRRLSDMHDDGIAGQILSPMPELLSHWLPAEEADDLCKIVNEQISTMIRLAPSHFRGIGMVPIQNPELAARRLEEIRALGFLGVEIGTHVAGIPLGDKRLDPFYAAAEALGLVILVHPLHPAGLERVGHPPELAAIATFPLETALATASLLGGKVLQRFPRCRFLLSHGGGAACWIAPRIDFALTAIEALRIHLPETASETLKRFWYDTITYDSLALNYLADRVGNERLVVGSDYPFAIRQKKPAVFAEQSLPGVDFSANATALFSLAEFPEFASPLPINTPHTSRL
jgi:aminocarboxymuconate-semialdehyde decarboxylase